MAINRKRRVRWDYTINYSTDGINSLVEKLNAFHWFNDTRDDGQPMPNYKYRIKHALSATTPLSGTKCLVNFRRAKVRHVEEFLQGSKWVPRTHEFDGFVTTQQSLSEPGTPTISASKADSIASLKFFRKVKDAEQSFAGLQWVGELRESIRMFRNPLQGLRKSARDDYLEACKRLKRRYPKSWKDGLAETYLEWFYGWRPVVHDVEDAFKTLDRLSVPRLERKMIHAVGKDKSNSSTVEATFDEPKFSFNLKTEDAQTVKVIYKGLYAREVSRSGKSWNFGNTMELLGFTLDNFVPTVWELLPWSFLVDYFTNVGDILECSFTSLANVRWVNRTARYTASRTHIPVLNEARTRSISNGVPWRRHVAVYPVGPHGYNSASKVVFVRSKDGPSVPPLQFEVPSSPTKWIAMAALFNQANTVHPQRFRMR